MYGIVINHRIELIFYNKMEVIKQYSYDDSKKMHKCTKGTEEYYGDLIPPPVSTEYMMRFGQHLNEFANKYTYVLPIPKITNFWMVDQNLFIVREPYSDYDKDKVFLRDMVISMLYTIHFMHTYGYRLDITSANYALDSDWNVVLKKYPCAPGQQPDTVREYLDILAENVREIDPSCEFIDLLKDKSISLSNCIKIITSVHISFCSN